MATCRPSCCKSTKQARPKKNKALFLPSHLFPGAALMLAAPVFLLATRVVPPISCGWPEMRTIKRMKIAGKS